MGCWNLCITPPKMVSHSVYLSRVMLTCQPAGIPLDKLAGSQTGVYVGCFSSDYSGMTGKDLDVPLKHAGSGTIASMLSNRVSWFFDLRGPSLTIDTACSSSLVATHEACVSLKQGEISMVCAVYYFPCLCSNTNGPRPSWAGVTSSFRLR